MNSEQLIIRLARRYNSRVLPLSATVKTYLLSQVNQNLDDLRSANIQGAAVFDLKLDHGNILFNNSNAMSRWFTPVLAIHNPWCLQKVSAGVKLKIFL